MKRAARNRLVRYGLMTVISVLTLYVALGFGQRNFEAFCPFGGMESLWGLFTTGQFTCALSPLNLSMLVGVLALTLLTKKAFCGWACPIGFLSELGMRLTGLFWKRRPQPSAKLNGALKFLRYVALALALVFTYKTGELILRGYDPFYLIFSAFGHGSVGMTSYIVLAALVAGALIVPMFFCRYLCPLGAVFDPFSRLGIVKVVRNDALCTQCDLCQKVCPHDLAVQKMVHVRHRDCTNCLECVDACPVTGALELKATL